MSYKPDEEICDVVRGDIDSNKTKGLQLPSLTTTQRDNIATPAMMIIWNSTTTQLEFHDGAEWIVLAIVGP
jgi:hypothetical protein